MATGIELAGNLVQAKLRTLAPTYISNAPDKDAYPTAMDDALCPYALTWAGPGSWYQKGGGYKVDERTLEVFVFVESLAQKDIPTRTGQGERVLEAVKNLFLIPANIPLDDGTISGYQITLESKPGSPHTDTGLVSEFPFSGKLWFGFNIHLNCRIMWIV